MSQRHATERLPGLLQQAPAVLDRIIKRLDRRSRRAVFFTCRYLAIQVLLSGHGFRVLLCTPPLEAPRHHMTKWLDVENTLGRGLLHMQSLRWTGPSMLTDEELNQFCDVLEQGQLQQLNCLGMVCSLVKDGSEALQARLALALGHHLTHLETTNKALLDELPRFPHLRYLHVNVDIALDQLSSWLSTLIAVALLCDFTFRKGGMLAWSKKKGHPTISGKRWIVNRDTTLEQFAIIPLENITELELQGLPCFQRQFGTLFLKDLWLQHGSKIVCTPDTTDCAYMLNTTDPFLSNFFKVLRGVRTINVMADTPLAVVHELYSGLPACVRCVNFVVRGIPSAHSILHGLPSTITMLGLYQCTISARVLSDLISGVPHVLTLKVVNPFTGEGLDQRLYPDELDDSTWVTLANVEWIA